MRLWRQHMEGLKLKDQRETWRGVEDFMTGFRCNHKVIVMFEVSWYSRLLRLWNLDFGRTHGSRAVSTIEKSRFFAVKSGCILACSSCWKFIQFSVQDWVDKTTWLVDPWLRDALEKGYVCRKLFRRFVKNLTMEVKHGVCVRQSRHELMRSSYTIKSDNVFNEGLSVRDKDQSFKS